MSDTVILSFPFSGALYHYFDQKINSGNLSTKPIGYYRWLYGKNPQRSRQLALTLLILHPKIIMPTRDHPLPQRRQGTVTISHSFSDLGIIGTTSEEGYDIRQATRELVQEDLDDNAIIHELAQLKIPPYAREFLLADIREEIELAKRHRAKIVSVGGRRRLIALMLSRETRKRASLYPKPELEFVERYLTRTQLEFNPQAIDELYYIKESPDVVDYARHFRNTLNTLLINSTDEVDPRFDQLVNDSLEKSPALRQYAKQVRRLSSHLSWGNTLLSFIPGVSGLTASVDKAIEVGSDQSAKAAEEEANRLEWWMFAPKVAAAQMESRIVRNNRRRNLRS